jgi:hypothetical protein
MHRDLLARHGEQGLGGNVAYHVGNLPDMPIDLWPNLRDRLVVDGIKRFQLRMRLKEQTATQAISREAWSRLP